jgi:restriction system protein
MADVTRKRTGQLLRKLFEVLIPKLEGVQARDALAAVAASIELTEYERGTYQAGARRFEKILRFATIDCVKAGWLLKTKGKWTVTEAGREAYLKHTDPETFYKRAVALYREWKATQPDSQPSGSEEAEDQTSGKSASITFEEAEEQAWSEIERYLTEMKPYDFQELVASLLRAMGYQVTWVAPPGKDGGIDILAWTDPLGTRPPRIKVQVKRQTQAVNVEGLRSFMALLNDDDVGLFVASGGFTKDAADEARTQEKRKVTLINLEKVLDLWVEHYDRLADDARRRLPLRPIYFLAPEG